MRLRSQLVRGLCVFGVLAVLPSCSGREALTVPRGAAATESTDRVSPVAVTSSELRWPASVLPAERQRLIRAGGNAGTGFVRPSGNAGDYKGFFSDFNDDAVFMYDSRGTLVGTLTGFSGPQGLATDAAGALYVADTNDYRIQVYAPPYNAPPTTLGDGGQEPVDVAVDSSGNVAATNIMTWADGPGSVTFYAKGGTEPVNTVSSADFARIYFCAFDASGNLYLDGTDADFNTLVGEIVGGVTGSTIVSLTKGNAIGFPGGVQVTKSGLLSIDDQMGRTIDTYNPPVGGSLGMPVRVTPLIGADDPVTFAIGPAGKHLFSADAGLDSADKYSFPAGGTPVQTVTFPSAGLPIGSATTPTEQF